MSKKSSLTIPLSICSLFLLTFILFPIDDAYSFKIHCASDVDLEEFPICGYEDLWNQSERFNELVVDELANRANDINADHSLFQNIYSDSLNKINQENPGLYEEGQEIKSWISEQLVKKV